MPTYAYIPQPLDDRDGAFEASRVAIQKLAGVLGLHVDREFVEEPGACYVAWEKRDWRLSPLADRPVGKELLAALQSGDAMLVDNPMLEPRQLATLLSELAKRGVELHVAQIELLGFPSGPQLGALLSYYFELERRCASRCAQDGMLVAKLEGRPSGGRPAPGWKHIGPPERRRRLPDEDEREVMLEIVKLRTKGWGFRRIATFLRKQRIMYRVPDRKRRLGYRLEFWSHRRCELAYAEMLRILAEDRAEKNGRALAGSA